MRSLLSTAAPAGAAFLCLSAAGGALAEDAAPAVDVEPVVITATRTPTALDQVASSITLITGDDIEAHQWRTLPDALNDAPGLNVVQAGGPGAQTSVFIRGANSNHTKVLIDGIDVNDPSNGLFDFGQMLTADLARVEILRGPQSSLYGSDALGGVINIITREGQGPARLTASLEGGSFKTLNETGGVSGSAGAFSYAADIAHVYVGDSQVTPVGLLAPGEARIGNVYDNVTAGAKLGYAFAGDASLHLVVRYTKGDLKFTSDNFNVYPAIPDSAQSEQSSRDLFARGEARFSLAGGALRNILGLGYTDYSATTTSPDAGVSPSLAAGNRLKVDYQGTLALGRPGALDFGALVFGAEANQDRLLASPIDASDGYRAGYLEWQSHPAAGLSFAASVRYDDDDRAGGKTTWRLAPTYLIPGTGTQVKATYGTGFKAPTLTQLFVSYPAFGFYANPNLKPETSEGYDVGFEQPLARGRLRFGATWFHSVIRNLIDDNADFSSYANVGRATTYGVESFASAILGPRLSARADYTYTVARDDVAHAPLLRRPKTKASLTGTWRATDRLTLSASLIYVGAWADVARDALVYQTTASPYATTGLAGSYDLGHGITLFARIDNLLDRHFQNPVGFDHPGIGAFGGVKVGLPP